MFSLDVVGSFPASAVRVKLGDTPSLDEIRGSLSWVVGNKAGGVNGILPEMVKVSSGELLEYLFDLFTCVWEDGSVPQDWRDALLVPVLRTGTYPCVTIVVGLAYFMW